MKLGLRVQGHFPAARMEDALERSESGKRRLNIAEGRTKDVIGEKATKRASVRYSKLGVGEAPPGGAALGSSDPSGSVSSRMAVDETVNQGAKRVRLGPAPSDDNRADGAQRQAMEFVDWA